MNDLFRLADAANERAGIAINNITPIQRNFRRLRFSIDDINDERVNGVKYLSNFSMVEFNQLYDGLKSGFVRKGRGKTFPLDDKNMLLITLLFLKTNPKFKTFGTTLQIPSSSIKRMVNYTVKVIIDTFDPIYFPLGRLNTSDLHFDFHVNAIAAVDVSIMPVHARKSISISREYFSFKHHIHCIKLQCAVAPNGQCIHYDVTKKGSVHDIEVFHQSNLLSKVQYTVMNGNIPALLRKPMIFDKGYVGLQHVYPESIIMKKKPRGGELNTSEIESNDRIQHDRVIVENYFSRLKLLWIVTHDVFRGDDATLIEYVKACVILTNYHITLHPLRADELVENHNLEQEDDVELE